MIFCFENYYDLLEKVKHDRSVINTSSELNENDFYPIINTILTLNHLFEWYYKDESLEKEKRVECIKRFNTYDSIKNQNNNYNKFISINGKALEININQRLIRQLANNLKHFKMKNIKKTEKKPKYLAVAGNMRCGSHNARCGYYEEYRYIVLDKEENEFDLIKIIDELIQEWDNFLEDISLHEKSGITNA